MNLKQKIILTTYFPFILLGLAQAVNDFLKNNDVISITNLAYGLGYEVPLTYWIFGTPQSIINMLFFLVTIPLCTIYAFWLGYQTRSHIAFTSLQAILLIIAQLLLVSTIWDTVFTTLLFSFWNVQLLSDYCYWLPMITPNGQIGGIIFTWETGIWFIVYRWIAIIIVTTLLMIETKTTRQTYEKRKIRRR